MTQISTSVRGLRGRRLRWLWAGALALPALLLSAPATAALVACTPEPGYNTCTQVTYSGGNQTFTVPTGVSAVFIKAWGAGGGGPNTSYYTAQRGGGGGGFASGTLTVTAGSSLGIRVGQGGRVNDTGNPYGGGGAGGNGASISRGASGGGLSGVFTSTTSFTQGTARLIAGAGGGSSPGADVGTPSGAGGGGLVGGSDGTTASGKGGTQSAGGAAGSGGSCNVASATAGSALQGGRGASTNQNQNEGGGGGGAGYYGGGGGICQGTDPNGMGGGGSSYLASALSGAGTESGSNSPADNTGGAAANTDDPQYVAGIAVGGGGDASGGNGLVVLQYNVPAPVLALSKTAQATVTPGGAITYTLSLTNNGTAATGTTVIVRDQLPPGVIATAATRGTNVSAVSCGTLPSAAGALLTCTMTLPAGGIPVGATRTFTLTATAPTLAGTLVTNYASSNTNGSGTPATNPGTGCTSNATVSCDSADTTVVAGPATAAQSGLRVVTDNQPANGTAQDVLEVFVRDASGNPVGAGAVVNFGATPNVAFNGGAVGAAGSCTTTAASLCQTTATSTVATTYATTAVTLGGTALGGNFTAGGNAYLPSPRPYKFAPLPTTLTISKVSLNNTGAFGFTGSNGVATQTLTTVTAGTAVTGTTQTLTASGVATTITESVPPANYALTGVSCTGLGAGGTATPDLPNRKVTLDAAATAAGSNIACTFTNTYTPPYPKVRIVKTTTSGSGTNVFAFALSGLSASTDSITVTGVGSANGAANLTGTAGLEASISESAPAGWPANPISASCVDAASANPNAPFGTLVGNRLTLPAANMVAGADIRCTFVNGFGYSVSGRVFLDNGAGAGTANDGLVNGGEAGIAGAPVRLTNCGATVISTATTDGSGSYALDVPFGTATNAPLCVEQTNAASRVSTGASFGSVRLPSGSAVTNGGTTYTYTRAGTPDRIAFTWNGSGHSGLNFGDVERNTLAADGAKSGPPGSTVSYAHTFVARTGGSVSFSISDSVDTPAIGGWSGKIFADTGCTGALQPGAALLYPPSAPVTVVAGQSVCLVMQEFIPTTAGNGNNNRSTVQASFNFTNAGPALSASYTVLDITTVSNSALELKKEVRNVTQGGSFGVNNQAKSGETLEYRVTYTNNGMTPISGMTVNDTTPQYTSFVAAQAGTTPASLTGCSKNTPANAVPAPAVACATAQTAGGTGGLRWAFGGSLSPGGTGEVLFSVKVD
ncbi:hypothetical protein [Variovorax sp. EL159]|uniref:beta strand repeat-containing protein n=1 Tax=Variovorax sp. EL159 TaxID=1566270 RepID=UPI0008815DA8|nr:hypothetical protein [Variovorax sp. EL159]SCX73162.1 conserved repeat domain-containing protein [Variovorax sp. EL159]